MKVWLLFILALVADYCYSQEIRLEVVDASTRRPVAYAEVYLNKDQLRFFTDSAGRVEIPANGKLKSTQLQVKRMGYLSESLRLDSLKKVKNPIVSLLSDVITLPEVKIKDVKAESMLLHVRKAIVLSLQSELVLPAFYRQAHVENDRLVFLTESELQTQFQKQKSKAERVSVLRLRRIPSVEQNKEKHSDHLVDLLSSNPVFHPEGTILNIYTGDEFVFSYRNLEGDSSEYGEIKFASADSVADFVEAGRIVFLEEGYRIEIGRAHV